MQSTNSVARGVRNITLAAAGMALVFTAILPSLVAAAGSVRFSGLSIGDHCIGMVGTGGDSVHLTWKSGTGALKADETFLLNEYGGGVYCAPDPSTFIASGDRLKVVDASSVHKLTIPVLSMRLNRVTASITGTGPAGKVLKVYCPNSPFPAFEPCMWTKNVTVPSNGQWSVNYPYGPITGGSFGSVVWKNAAGDRVYANAIAPYVEVILGTSGVNGAFRQGETANVQIQNPTTHAVKATTSAVGDSLNGEFSAVLRDAGDHKYSIAPGDRLVSNISSDVNWVVPNVDGTASAATDMVSGHCYDAGSSAKLVEVWIYRNAKHFGPAIVDVDVTGYFEFNFHETTWDSYRNGAEVHSGDTVWLMCMQSGGDWVDKSFIAGA
jgi:hypothetical protein